jgi:hypothetical protein
LNLSYECLTGAPARLALAERIKASPDFLKSLQRPETGEAEDEESFDEEFMDENEVEYDEIDSSKTIDEEVEDLILQKSDNLPTYHMNTDSAAEEAHILGAHMERYTGHEFTARTATNDWMAWDAAPYM